MDLTRNVLKGGLHEIFCVFFLHQHIVHVMCLMCVTFIFENENNLLVKKASIKTGVYGFFRFAVSHTCDVTSGSVPWMWPRVFQGYKGLKMFVLCHE